MKKLSVFLCAMSLVFGVAVAAPATIIPSDLAIDFRSPEWTGANGESLYTVGNVTVRAYDFGNSGWCAELYQDEGDGLGVLGGEDDEIDRSEIIWVHIESGMMLNGVLITDLFDAPDGGGGEEGHMLFSALGASVHFFQFYGNDANQDNGEIWVDFGGQFWVNNAVFFSNPCRDYDGSEFSVAGFTVAAVPEPATMLLVGVGLIGLAGLGKKRFVKKT